MEWLEDGEGSERRADCAKAQGVEIAGATSSLSDRRWALLKQGISGYAGGDAPGVKFENGYGCHEGNRGDLL